MPLRRDAFDRHATLLATLPRDLQHGPEVTDRCPVRGEAPRIRVDVADLGRPDDLPLDVGSFGTAGFFNAKTLS